MRGAPLAVALSTLLASACAGEAPARTNVVLIVVESLRADALADARTPSIERLKRDGVDFPLAFSHSPETLPAHAALFSSRLPHATGVVRDGARVASDVELFPAWLAREGWHAEAAVGLATLWPSERGAGLDRGFVDWRRTEHEVAPAREVLALAAELLEGERPDGGLFLFVHLCEPHQPYDAHGAASAEAEMRLDGRALARLSIADALHWTSELVLPGGDHELTIESRGPFHLRDFRLEIAGRHTPTSHDIADVADARTSVAIRFESPGRSAMPAEVSLWIHDSPPTSAIPARYRAEVEAADAAVGALLAELDRRGLYESALVVLTSGHGEALGDRGVVGHGAHLHDELLHVPLVVKLPRGHAKARALATTREALVRHVDVVPTLVDLLDLPLYRAGEGVSLFDRAERVLLAEAYPPAAAHPLFALRDDRRKMVLDAESDRLTLYDLRSDPGEKRDVHARLAGERPSWPEVLRRAAREARDRGVLDAPLARGEHER